MYIGCGLEFTIGSDTLLFQVEIESRIYATTSTLSMDGFPPLRWQCGIRDALTANGGRRVNANATTFSVVADSPGRFVSSYAYTRRLKGGSEIMK